MKPDKEDKLEKKAPRPDENVQIKVATPKGVFVENVSTSITVENLIKHIAEKEKLPGGDRLELYNDNTKLAPPDAKLSNFNLQDGVGLVLVAQGSGV